MFDVYGESRRAHEFSNGAKCAACVVDDLFEHGIRCAMCGFLICPGDSILLYPFDGWDFPPYAMAVTIDKIRWLLGCMRTACNVYRSLFSGTWTAFGYRDPVTCRHHDARLASAM
jgi:hypothetical protein